MGRILSAIEADLGRLSSTDQVSWSAQVARALAEALDDEPNASMARELRSVMAVLMDGAQGVGVDGVDEIAAARRARRAKVQGGS